jgi:hypothetical protein
MEPFLAHNTKTPAPETTYTQFQLEKAFQHFRTFPRISARQHDHHVSTHFSTFSTQEAALPSTIMRWRSAAAW